MVNPRAVDAYLQDFQQWLLAADFVPAAGISNGWQGAIYIDWEDIQSGVWNSAAHQVTIILPPGFPYHAPVVLSTDTPVLTPSWHFSPQRCLCLWREPGGWNPFMSAQKLLERIRDWFHHYHTGDWPEDFTPTDLHLYLENEGMIVIGDEWCPPTEERKGTFALWRNNKYKLITPSLVGLRDQQGKANKEMRLVSALSWIEQGVQTYPGVWFRVNEPFVPASRLEMLLKQIDQYQGVSSGTTNDFLIRHLSRVIACDGFSIAIGYPGTRQQEQWLFLWVRKPTGRKLHLANQELIKAIEVRSFSTEPARKSDLLRRTIHLSKDLSSKRVALFGVGALGGSIALLLAKAGLGEIRIIDSDQMKPTNVIRHIAGLDEVGIDKTFAVRRKILRHNPDCVVMRYEETWKEQELERIIKDVDLVIDATANASFSLWLNQIIIRNKVSVLYTASYRRASVGRLILYRSASDQDDPCLACYLLNEERWEKEAYPIIPSDPTTTFEEEGCASVTEEADAIHLEMVANLSTLTAVKFFSGQALTANLLLQVNEPLTDADNILSNEGQYKVKNSALHDCPICKGSM